MQNKNILIVGASSGIGAELCKQLSEQNNKIAITGRRIELLKEVRSTQPENISVHVMDVKDTNSTLSALNNIHNSMGHLDCIIISAGTGDLNSDLEFSIEQNTMDTNVFGFTLIATWAFKVFQEQGQGHLVGISSIGGLMGNHLAPSYNASKAYQINYLKGLKQKAAKTKLPIHVTDIRPGFVETAMAKGEGLFWVSPVDKAAKLIIKDIDKKRLSSYISRRWKAVACLVMLLPESLIYLMMS